MQAGNASRTLLYDITALDWNADLLDVFGVPTATLPVAVASDQRFGATSGVPLVPDGTPIVAVMADSHAALFGQGCTEVGMAKATARDRRSWLRSPAFPLAMLGSR